MKGYAVTKMPKSAQTAIWTALDGIDAVSSELKRSFSFPNETDGFLPMGGEHAKYTTNLDLCDRFCYWYKNRHVHRGHEFTNEKLYAAIVACEKEMHAMAQQLISGIWNFFNGADEVRVRENSYLQLCVYANEHREDERSYLQDCHEDGHLITLIKPTRDGLVIFPAGPKNPEVSVFLRDDELLAITGSLLTAISEEKIPPMYHAVRNPFVRMMRKSIVYFAIPDLSQSYTTFFSRNEIDISKLADESHRAFGNSTLI
jgi:hypothetical protein